MLIFVQTICIDTHPGNKNIMQATHILRDKLSYKKGMLDTCQWKPYTDTPCMLVYFYSAADRLLKSNH